MSIRADVRWRRRPFGNRRCPSRSRGCWRTAQRCGSGCSTSRGTGRSRRAWRAAAPRRPGRVVRRTVRVVRRVPPVRAPLPDVADRLPEPVLVGLEAVHRCGGEVAVLEGVVDGEAALPDVAVVRAVEGVTPGVPLPRSAPAGGALPLGLRRQGPPRPAAVGLGVVPADVHHRMVVEALEVRPRAAGVPPVGAVDAPPPRRALGRTHHRVRGSGDGELEHGREAEGLGLRAVSGVAHELREVGVRHRGRVDRVRSHGYLVHRPFTVGPLPVAERVAHGEHLPGDSALRDGMPIPRRAPTRLRERRQRELSGRLRNSGGAGRCTAGPGLRRRHRSSQPHEGFRGRGRAEVPREHIRHARSPRCSSTSTADHPHQ